jgi:dUTP pyrophosphatase
MPSGLKVELRVLDERIRTWGLPRYQSEMAAAIDLHACLDEPLILKSQSAAVLVPSGVAIHIGDPNVAAVILPRSGLGHARGLVLGNLVGLLDADFTGQIFVSCWNRSGPNGEAVTINPGDRIAQLLFMPILRPSICVVEDFSRPSMRGAGGFGSTGHAAPSV